MNELKKALKINKLVSIETLNDNGETVRYASRVENIGQDWICLAAPMSRRLPVYLPPETCINVLFWDNLAVYSFKTTVIKSLKEGSVRQLSIRYPEKYDKVQNRQYVRVPVSLNVTIQYVNKEDETKEVVGKTRDLSGGGMMVTLKKSNIIKKNSLVTINFRLDDTVITCSAVIVRDDIEMDSDHITRGLLGVKFLSISDKNRQLIIKFVFNKQIELRRKGLL